MHARARQVEPGGARRKTRSKSSKQSGPLGFYEVRKRRNELLAKLREETRETGTSFIAHGRTSGPRFTAGLALGAAGALFAMLITRVIEKCASGRMDTVEATLLPRWHSQSSATSYRSSCGGTVRPCKRGLTLGSMHPSSCRPSEALS